MRCVLLSGGLHMTKTIAAFGLAVFLTAALPAYGQEAKIAPQIAGYKVEFNLRDHNDAAAKAGRRYSMLVNTTGKGVFKVGNRVPVATGSGGNGVNTQFMYVDVGLNIDCLIRESEGKVGLRADFDVSSIVQPDKAGGPVSANPIIGQ